MRILLRVLVVFLLFLSIGALVFGIILFGQREQLKARTDRLENEIVSLAATVEVETFDDLARRRGRTGGISKKDLKRYYRIDPATGKRAKQVDPSGQTVYITNGEGTMDKPLLELQERARNQLERLDSTRVELVGTRDDLAASRALQKRTAASLAASQELNISLQATISEQDTQIIEREVQIETKDAQIVELNDQIDSKDSEIAQLKEDTVERDDHILDLKRHIENLQEEINVLRERDTQGEIDATITEGYKGDVLKMNPKYNFVVIDTAPAIDPRLSAGLELLVQRKTTFVGKVRILSVKSEENIAIAQVLPKWLQMPIQKGDRLVYERMIR